MEAKRMKQIVTVKDNSTIEYREKIGMAIREIREKRGYSQSELAERMNINTITISKIESGKFSFNIDYLSRFSHVLNFDFNLTDKKADNF